MEVNSLISFDNDGALVLAVVIGFKKEKTTVFSERNRELDLAKNRIHPIGKSKLKGETNETRLKALTATRTEAESHLNHLNAATMWELLVDQTAEIESDAVAELLFANPTLSQYVAVRLLLQQDRVYFKRNKESFSPRPKTVVESLIHQELILKERENKRRDFITWFKQSLSTPTPPPEALLDEISLLKRLAALAPLSGNDNRSANDLLDLINEVFTVDRKMSPEEFAEASLRAVNLISPRETLIPIRHDLRLELERGTLEDEPLFQNLTRQELTLHRAFTIDDASTKDMDDAISLVKTESGYELGIHITDVASQLRAQSPLDYEALARGTSVYTPTKTFHMLPRSLSEQQLSLTAGTKRRCLTVLVKLSPLGDALSAEVFPSFIDIHNRYSYDEIDLLIEDETSIFAFLRKVTLHREHIRLSQGGFRVAKKDFQPMVDDHGHVTLQELKEDAPARAVIGELMVFANSVFANFCSSHQLPIPYRTQEAIEPGVHKLLEETEPGPAKDFLLRTSLKRSLVTLSPGFHATLGLQAYTQATSPIRRYLDIIVQRQLLSFFAREAPFYSESDLSEILGKVEDGLQRANAVSRETKRYWLLVYLQQRLRTSRIITGVVVRIDGRNPLVELDEIFLTMPVRCDKKPGLGEVVDVTIISVDPKQDHVRLEVRDR